MLSDRQTSLDRQSVPLITDGTHKPILKYCRDGTLASAFSIRVKYEQKFCSYFTLILNALAKVPILYPQYHHFVTKWWYCGYRIGVSPDRCGVQFLQYFRLPFHSVLS